MIALAMDISGNFKEGKGVTGWCVMRKTSKLEVVRYGTLCAEDYDSAESYWDANVRLINRFHNVHTDAYVVIEDYVLYATKARSQINSNLETSQLLGILKYYCWSKEIPIKIQKASEVKTRWSDRVLEHKGLCLSGFKNVRHVKDAIRHASHFLTFYKG